MSIMQFDPYQKNKKIRDVMSPIIVSLESTATASDAAKIMETRNAEAVVVVEDKKLVGIITDRDFTIKIGAHAYPIDTPINRLMSYPLVAIDENAEISNAKRLMEEKPKRPSILLNHNQQNTLISPTLTP